MSHCDRIEFAYLMSFLFVEFHGTGRRLLICRALRAMEMFSNDSDIKYFSVFCKYKLT